MAAPSTAIDQIAELLASRGLASFEPKIGESPIPDSDRIFLASADPISDELRQFPKSTRAQVRVFTLVEAHVRNHQRISFPEPWKRLAVQRLSGNECRKHRSSRRTGAVLSVTGLQHSASFQPSLELSLRGPQACGVGAHPSALPQNVGSLHFRMACTGSRPPSIIDAMTIVRPETIVRWHRAGFRAFWRWKSRPG